MPPEVIVKPWIEQFGAIRTDMICPKCGERSLIGAKLVVGHGTCIHDVFMFYQCVFLSCLYVKTCPDQLDA